MFFISVYVVYENALDDFNIYFIFFSLFIYFLIPPRNYLGFLTGRALLVNNLICTLPERMFQLKHKKI